MAEKQGHSVKPALYRPGEAWVIVAEGDAIGTADTKERATLYAAAPALLQDLNYIDSAVTGPLDGHDDEVVCLAATVKALRDIRKHIAKAKGA